MSTTPTLHTPASAPPSAPGPRSSRRLVIWLWILGAVAVIATAVAVAYATGFLGDEPAEDTPADEPADDVPADEPADEVPADDVPADEPADDVPADEPDAVRYDEEPRANWDVTGVAADDVLNVRDAPGVDGAIIATLAHDAAELESTGRIAYVGDQLWREVVVPGDGVGWVSATYLTETTPP